MDVSLEDYLRDFPPKETDHIDAHLSAVTRWL
jgi:hypothetical protein